MMAHGRKNVFSCCWGNLRRGGAGPPGADCYGLVRHHRRLVDGADGRGRAGSGGGVVPASSKPTPVALYFGRKTTCGLQVAKLLPRSESGHCQKGPNQNKCRTDGSKSSKQSWARMQNTSHAVMAQRAELKNSLDDFPTPPWATRALIEHVVVAKNSLRSMTCLEPACGRGHMAVALAPYFREVASFDVFDYGFGGIADFLKAKHAKQSFDWVITNPPFRLGEEFINRSMNIARHGIAMLTRTVFIESVGRYERLFKLNPPTRFAQFTERVPMVKGEGVDLLEKGLGCTLPE